MKHSLLIALAIATGLSIANLQASNYTVPSYGLGGGGTSQGPVFAVAGLIATHPTQAASGARFRIEPGSSIWPTRIPTPEAPAITCTVNTTSLILSWPDSATRFRLEKSTSLDVGSWTPVAAEPTLQAGTQSVVLPREPGVRFFRLSRP
jgi:hypothetical protein